MTCPYREMREAAAKCREAVPVLPGDMPDEMWGAIRNDKDAVQESMRIVVRQTKENISTAIRNRTKQEIGETMSTKNRLILRKSRRRGFKSMRNLRRAIKSGKVKP